MTCPTFEILIDYADGGRSRSEEIAAHLSRGCATCEETLTWDAGFVETAGADTSVEPPVWVTRRAVSLFAEAREAANERGVRGLVSRLWAALVFDSMGGSLSADAIPARTGASASRQLLYSAAPYDIDLFIANGSTPESISITGQVLSSDVEGFESLGGLTVTIELGGDVAAAAETSEFGEFTMRDVAPGVYNLRLVGETREIVISETPITLA
jgi:hypothetical protein